ncbi:uncharacterized protein A1O9_10060 [Exophiala aquamarina CBS 119918]|uniref:RNA polymerase II-associated protein 1 C-terminal domain-containing protein n=1 Tax=Exophiala aquamarina CBS 119918 TaxID=1182545 RepID=A0A072PDL6_9EURO|nr:uncharacterized protein A1O9_10060 [Exophiala aquamarina CBS 119918]KEF53660.1 hypothetical protein A1O9_10060 [Exophiala aquamarina CBS 119918]
MAIPGQRFELDLDADDFTVRPLSEQTGFTDIIKDLQEHDSSSPPPPPAFKSTKSGFPEHKYRFNASAFKKQQQQQQQQQASRQTTPAETAARLEPSDRAITHQVGKKYGVNFDTQQKADINEENKRRIAEMSPEDIEEARAELMRNLNPAFLERLLKRANIEEDSMDQNRWPGDAEHDSGGHILGDTTTLNPAPESSEQEPSAPTIHFPAPPRPKSDFVPLDSNDPSFLSDLKSQYFPEMSHDPSSLSWLQDPTEAEEQDSLYNPERDSFPPSALRFGFDGRLIPPKESLEIDVKQGLHHHGDAPSSAGYTIPELSLLARSSLANQRCMAYQVLGRILFRIGRGDFGARGSELQEALWALIEHEKPLDVMMSEANRQSGHASAKAHAIEALWLWRKGGGGDRGVLKPGQNLAK